MWRTILIYIGCLFFAFMLIAPYSFQIVKLLLAFCLLIPYGVLLIKKQPLSISKNLMIWIFVYICMGLFYITYALFRYNPAPIFYFPVYVLWPILFFLITILIDKDIYFRLVATMRYAFTIIAITGIIAFLYLNFTLGVDNGLFGFAVSIRPGFPFLAIYSGAVTSMIFLYVYFLALYFLDKRLLKKLDIFNLIIGFVFIFATSRRVIFMIIAMTIVIATVIGYIYEKEDRAFFKKAVKKNLKILFFFIVIVAAIVIQFELFELDLLFEFVQSAIGDESAGVGYDPRLAQYDSLIEGWRNAPILGNATGINASVVRSELPGNYELSYVALLFERGLIGVAVYAAQFILLNFWMLRSIKNNAIPTKYSLATLIAFDMFMFANATNPYLNAFDHLWVIFFVLVVINLNQKKGNEELCVDKSL